MAINGLTSNSRARVTVTLEISISDNWGGDTTVDQIVSQAKTSAIQKLVNMTRSEARIIGEPVVNMIMVDGKNA